MDRLKDKIALITGSAQGIGLSIAQAFVREGARVIMSDINDSEGKAQARAIGAQAEYVHLDVCEPLEWQMLMKRIKDQYQRLDILVNNAGICCDEISHEQQDRNNISLEAWEKLHLINSEGVFLGCKYGIQMMKDNSGPASIINVSSRTGTVEVPGSAISKDSVRNHTKSVALYCAQKNYPIRCNSLHPAAILTPLWEAVLGKGRERVHNLEKLTREVPLHRLGLPAEVAQAAVFLASDECLFMTGSELVIDGGILASSGVLNPPGTKSSGKAS